jgi:GcrA cell cycle regulator
MTHDAFTHVHDSDPPAKRKKWPEAWSRLVVEGYAAGILPTQIAADLNARFGCNLSGHAVAMRSYRMNIKPRWRTEWNDERKAYLAELMGDPEAGSYEAISRKINYKFGTTFSRNAVIGYAKRSGLASKKPSSSGDRYDGAGNLLPKAPRKPPAERKRPVGPLFKHPPRPSAEIIRLRCAEVTSRNLSFAELEASDCRYPEGDGPFTFCGNPKLKGSSYCTAHHFLCERPYEPRRRSAAWRTKQRCWTEAETELAIKMLDEGAPEYEFIEKLQRTKQSAIAKRERVRFLASTKSYVEQPGNIKVPVEVWLDRARRIGAQRSITARLCGDPAPGFSALDRKRAGGSQC